MSWNLGDIFDGVGEVIPPDSPALIHLDRRTSWSELTRRTNNLGAQLRARGAQPDDKIALYMRNCPEYSETLVASFKARLVHTNVNFRYLDDELWYILDNSAAKFVVYSAEFADRVAKLRDRLPEVAGWIQVGDTPAPFAEDYDALVEEGGGAPLGIERSPDDLMFIYTGGTTGMPKGVMWSAEGLWLALGGGRNIPAAKGVAPASLEQHLENLREHGPGPVQLPACPLMHGTGMLTALGNLTGGGCVVTLPGDSLDPVELWDAAERERVQSIVIVGDAFAQPMLNALADHPGRWQLDALRIIISSGVMWSREVKQGLLEHLPRLLLVDSFGSSEAVGFGQSVTSARGEQTSTAKFKIGEHCVVFTEDHREVKPGSGEKGFIARSGSIPVGYYKDPEKTAETFPTINGVRYSIPGDWCTVEEDGTLTLFGRGSVCINTAGEKVYPEEVEEALKTHPSVEDALVVGVEDVKWGQAVTGIVQLRRDAGFDEAEIRSHVRERLAGYKTPKRIFAVQRMYRAPNGKADYKGATEFARSQLRPS